LRSRSFGWLVARDTHTLLASRAYWLLLLATGFLTAQAATAAVATYAEMSAPAVGPAALAQGMSPLEGFVVPTFGALWLAGTLFLPFVAIHLFGHERRTGGWTLLIQGPARMRELLASKLLVITVAWLVAWIPVLLALILWRIAGNHLDGSETLAVFLGHLACSLLTIGIAAAAAAAMENEASAAVIVLGFTVGTWAVDFVGAERGGFLGALARITPGAVLHDFERGLVRVSGAAAVVVFAIAGFAIAAIWLSPRRRTAARAAQSVLAVATAVVITLAFAGSRASTDWSEDRRNSFPAADEHALATITAPVRVDVHLARGDPRTTDLRLGVFDKLARVVPNLTVTYRARTQTGLFEQSDSAYGEVWYAVGERRAMSRSSTPEIVLPIIEQLAGVTPTVEPAAAYPGYPLVGRPSGLGPLLFVGWPLLLCAGWFHYRHPRRATHALGAHRPPPGVAA
jgi:ABC-2 type transport system permease protein